MARDGWAGAGVKWAALLVLVLAAAAWWMVLGEGTPPGRRVREAAAIREPGDAENGRQVIREAGCGACHVIPGVAGARGVVGPSLQGFGARGFVAGVVANTPENLAAWILNPRALSSGTAMPAVGLGPEAARDAAAYLRRLRE